MKEQWYNKVKFIYDEKTGYYRNGTLHMLLHRYVWLCEKGEIPKGYEIHHKDFDRSNNDISNLECLSRSEHRKLHAELLTDEEREWRRKNLAENARPKAIEWHKSEEGRKWHKEHSNTEGLQRKQQKVCVQCGKEFEGAYHSRFCSNACKSKWRRDNHLDDIQVVCEICGKVFSTNKNHKPIATTCSKSCANKKWHNEYRQLKEEKKKGLF